MSKSECLCRVICLSFVIRCSSLALALVALFVGPARAERPNILFVMTDDQAPWALGVSGNPQASTPNMDKLFGEGAYLKNCFVTTPVCSPSRASLMTSRYGSELGITDWIHPAREPELGLDPATVTWPEALQAAGYRTGLVGKWHLGIPDRYHPTKTGFDYFMGMREGGRSPVDPMLEVDGKEQKLKGLTVDLITDHALKFIDESAEQDKPFLLCVHYRAPHDKWLPVADADMAPYKNQDMVIPNPDYPGLDVPLCKQWMREYLASVSGVDRNLGRILKAVDDRGLRDNTIVVFTSDHGYNMGHNGIWHKGNGHWILKNPPLATQNIPFKQRPNMYDHSLRVPTAVRWPGRIRAGMVIESTLSFLDWYPTLLAMAGVELPGGQLIRGRNALPILQGKKIYWDDDFYAQYSTHHQSKTHMRMLRTKRWKLVRDFLNPERDEFFDLLHDPAESTNLLRDTAPHVRRNIMDLDAKLQAKLVETGDPVLALRVADKSKARPLSALYISGGCCHDYPTQEVAISKGLSVRANVRWNFIRALVEDDEKLPIPAKLQGTDWAKRDGYDVIIHNQCWGAYSNAKGIDDFVAAQKSAGVGVLVIHCAMHTFRDGPTKEWDKLVGVESVRHGPNFAIHTRKLANHPILKTVPLGWSTEKGELYHTKALPGTTPLLEGFKGDDPDGTKQVCAWISEYGGARTFGTTLGHHNETVLDPVWLDMTARGLLWSCGKLGADGEAMKGYEGVGLESAEASVVRALRVKHQE